ncbi:hypothetical protein J2TS6_50580 [Paenibacillus albilobatus]|uniref:Uncharacterized protein n=1 Tax=Paenibacillus albilobatus TaxID=2716884 RepID=A0A919XJ80_9BACL|nr:hypothetical protein J2TS6_50580 [Paenibacillus albilobatus]
MGTSPEQRDEKKTRVFRQVQDIDDGYRIIYADEAIEGAGKYPSQTWNHS